MSQQCGAEIAGKMRQLATKVLAQLGCAAHGRV